MADTLPPKLDEIPSQSSFQVPQIQTGDSAASSEAAATTSGSTTNTSSTAAASSKIEQVKDTVVNSAKSTMETVANHPVTQSVTNGPVAQNVKDQASKTSAEASNLAATRKTPGTTANNGQSLTHYHSFFYSLLAWEHPRVTAISYATIVTSIFIARYVPVLRLTFKLLAYALGTTALTEGVGQLALGQSILSAVRPKRYLTIPREALDSTLEDVEQLFNFFVIESQRLLFAEDAAKTFVAFLASFIGYWLIKFTPFWGLSLIAVTTIYFVPLVYISNKELIDEQLNHASKIVNAQTAQVKDLAAQHTANATESLKAYTGDLSKQAQEYIGSAKRSISPSAQKVTGKPVTEKDFPAAPQEPFGVKTTADQVDDGATKLATGIPAS